MYSHLSNKCGAPGNALERVQRVHKQLSFRNCAPPCSEQRGRARGGLTAERGCGLVGAERSGGVTPTEEMQAADSPPTLTLAHSDVVSSALYGERLQCVRKQRVYIEQLLPQTR